jgi:hypothetical protein
LLHSHRLWIFAGYHLAYLARYGDVPGGVRDGNKFIPSFHDEFAEWLESGCPGLSTESLQQYLRENPLER